MSAAVSLQDLTAQLEELEREAARSIAAADGSHTAILLNGETVANIIGTHPVGLGEIVLVRAS